MVKTVTTARCLACDWVPEGTPAAVDRAADRHTRAEKAPHRDRNGASPVSAARTIERGYYEGSRRAGQVRRVHVIREEGPRGWDHTRGSQTMCGQGAWKVQNSTPIIRDAPHALPDGLQWCPKCTGHLTELLGRLSEVAKLLGLEVP